MARSHDLTIFGATGFVGRLLADHVARAAPSGLRVALAGRSLDRLEDVRAGLPTVASGWSLTVADATDPSSMATMAADTGAVATTVGPYRRYGMPLVTACAEAGTHYADLTGEVLFARDVGTTLHERAVETGARIVLSAGFDSVPSDLGMLLAGERAAHDELGGFDRATMVVERLKGGLSGGTIDSMRTQLEEIKADRDQARRALDPYALSPDRQAEPDLGRQLDLVRPRFDRELGTWVGPFVMAVYNTRIVRRSNALLDHAWGRTLRYREVMGFGPAPRGPIMAGAVTAGLAGLVAGMANGITRPVLDRLLPDPGEGPDAEAREAGRFRTRTHAHTADGAHVTAVVGAPWDPGYGATAVMLGQAALALAVDVDLPKRAGVLTPATGIGRALADRLAANGFTIEVERIA